MRGRQSRPGGQGSLSSHPRALQRDPYHPWDKARAFPRGSKSEYVVEISILEGHAWLGGQKPFSPWAVTRVQTWSCMAPARNVAPRCCSGRLLHHLK